VLLALAFFAIVRLEASSPEVFPVDFELDGPGENVDDVCFWVDPTDPAGTLLFVTTKDSGLVEVFNAVTGAFVSTIPGFGLPNNCAVDGDLLLTTDRTAGDVKVHRIPEFTLVQTFGEDMVDPDGIDVFSVAGGQTLVYVTDSNDASVHVYDLGTGALVRSFPTGFGGGIEPILADERYQRVFVSRGEKEDVRGIGVFDPEGSLLREIGATVFRDDAEGMAIYACGDDGYLVAADQLSSATDFEVFDRVTLEHLGTFHVQDGSGEYVNATDGIDILQTPVPGFPNGILAACDGCGWNLPDEMEVISWDRIATTVGLNRCPDGEEPDCLATPCTERVTVSADAFVSSLAPATNFGTAETLEIEVDPPSESETLLGVDVPDLTGFEILAATLRLTVSRASSAGSDDGGTLFVTTGDWTESAVTFDTRPAPISEPVGSAGPVERSAVVDFDVSSVIGGAGSYNFLLRSASANKAIYYARDADHSPPTLLLRVRAIEAPEVTITRPAEGTVITAGTPLLLRGSASDAEDGDLSSAITWQSDLDGHLGVGDFLTIPTLSAGLHIITARVMDSSFLTGQAMVGVRVVPETVELEPEADAYVESASPDSNFGSADTLWSDGRPERQAFLRFDVLGTAGVAIDRAILRLRVSGVSHADSEHGGTLHVISDTSWMEDVITYASRPAIDGPVLGSQGPVAKGEIVEFDVTPGVAGDGPVAFAIVTTSSDAVKYSSRESADERPTLVLSLRSESVPNAQPIVAITGPADGTVVASGASITFTATATDAEDGDLLAMVTWSSDVAGPLGMGSPLTVPSLVAGVHVIRAEVTDSDGLVGSAEIAVVLDGPPTVSITSPVGGSVLPAGDLMTLAAIASDPEEGDLSARVTWSSDRDGPLGSGTPLDVVLSVGAHLLTATATDALGGVGSATVQVSVIDEPPVVTILAPTDGSVVMIGEAVLLSGAALDAVDGDLGESLDWTSSLDGPLGTGGSLAVSTLGIGLHTMTATVTDAAGGQGSASVHVLVRSPMLVFTPAADTYVSAAEPATNFGLEPTVLADAEPEAQAFLRFVVSGTGGLAPDRATLRLTVSAERGAPSDRAGTVHAISDTAWGETTLTFADRPPIDDPPLATIAGPVEAGDVVDLDVTGAVAADGTFVFALVSDSSNGVRYISREGGAGTPQLLLINNGNTPPTLAITEPADGTTVAFGTPLALSAVATDAVDGDLSAAVEWASDRDGVLGSGATVIATALSMGPHIVTATVTNSGGATATASVGVTVQGTLLFGSTADAGVREDAPDKNYGASRSLTIDTAPSPEKRAYLRFEVTGVGAGTITRATLRLTVRDKPNSGSASGGDLHLISDSSWEEATITFATSPPVDGPVIASAGPVTEGEVVDFDITSAVRGDGRYDFALRTSSSDRAVYAARETGASGPQLIIVVE
jgi:myo-inositol-hexaphosphate 3-phosphohydrolase